MGPKLVFEWCGHVNIFHMRVQRQTYFDILTIINTIIHYAILTLKFLLNGGDGTIQPCRKRRLQHVCTLCKNTTEIISQSKLISVYIYCAKLHNCIWFIVFPWLWPWAWVRVMAFNATFNNISVISCWSVLLVEKPEYLEKTTDLPQVTDKPYHIMVYRLYPAWVWFELKTFVVISSYKSNYIYDHDHNRPISLAWYITI
jgi:hypothetical protein